MASRPKHENALRLAMRRLLGGDAGETDGSLSWTNVYVLAGVKKATAYRAAELRQEWAALVEARAKLAEAEVAEKQKPDSPAALRRTITIMANHIQALSLAVDHLETELSGKELIISGLRTELAYVEQGGTRIG